MKNAENKPNRMGGGSENLATTEAEKVNNFVLAEQQKMLRLHPQIRNAQGDVVEMSAEQFGSFVLDHYSSVSFNWVNDFAKYRDEHAMGPLVAQLKSNMDEISCDYIERFVRLHDVARVGAHCLVSQDLLLSPSDRMLLERNRQQVLAGNPPFLQQVNLEWSSSFTNWYGLYDMPAHVLKAIDGKAVFDVGGYIGDTLPLLRALFPHSQILSFEPDEHNFQQLQRLMPDEIAAGTILAFQQGLADKPGKLTLTQQSTGVESVATLLEGTKGLRTTEVDISTVDTVVKERNLDVGLIKIDVEGFEPQVIQGALETIKSQKPVLVIAIYHQPEEFYELKPFLEQLNLGYKFRMRRSCFCNLLYELVLIAYPEEADA